MPNDLSRAEKQTPLPITSATDVIPSNASGPKQEVSSAKEYTTESDIFGEHQEVFDANGMQLLIDMGFKALPPRTHPLEAKIAEHETHLLGYYAIEYEAYINVFSDGNEVVGGLILQRRWNAAIVYSFFVESHLRGLGLGKRILFLAEHLAQQMGASSLVLETSTLHTYEFYLKNGFAVLSELNGYIDGQTWFHMYKNLIVPETDEEQNSNLLQKQNEKESDNEKT